MDRELLEASKVRSDYDMLRKHVKPYTLSNECRHIFEALEKYYSESGVASLDWPSFTTNFITHHERRLSKPVFEICLKIINGMEKSPPPVPAVQDLLKHYLLADTAEKIIAEAQQILDGKVDSVDGITTVTKGYEKRYGSAMGVTDIFVPTDITSIVGQVKSDGLSWRLPCLNESLGPLRIGDFVLVAARPETGKTTFLASEVTFMATQLPGSRPVLWINNEERSVKVFLRVVQAALGWNTADIAANEARAMVEYAAIIGGKDKILVLSEESSINSVSQLDTLFEEYNPALIVFDQLDKVSGLRTEEGEHVRLGRLYKWARECSHKYGPVIAASQCDATAEGQQWIYMDQLRGSKVDKPGEVDAIVTIGVNKADSNKNMRYIHVPKNKLFGGKTSSEAKRHGYFVSEIKPEIARYEGSTTSSAPTAKFASLSGTGP